jgi:PilZ domain-containing protein
MSNMLWERRRSFRIPITGRALLKHHGRLEGLYRVEDVSIDGCGLVDGPCECEIGSRVNLTMHVDEGEDIHLPARVMRKEYVGTSSHLGLRFMKRSAAFEDLIQDLAIRSLEHDPPGDILVVHAHPERENVLFDTMRSLGHRIVPARTARDAVSVLEGAAQRIRMAFVSPVVGSSQSRDILKLITRRFPHVHCVMMSRGGAQRLVRAIREASPMREGPWSLARLRKVVSSQEKELAIA